MTETLTVRRVLDTLTYWAERSPRSALNTFEHDEVYGYQKIVACADELRRGVRVIESQCLAGAVLHLPVSDGKHHRISDVIRALELASHRDFYPPITLENEPAAAMGEIYRRMTSSMTLATALKFGAFNLAYGTKLLLSRQIRGFTPPFNPVIVLHNTVGATSGLFNLTTVGDLEPL